jgi:hypothetical protein
MLSKLHIEIRISAADFPIHPAALGPLPNASLLGVFYQRPISKTPNSLLERTLDPIIMNEANIRIVVI